ncbi:hypothetical protein MNBD_GAMMA21-3076 [hydrothermal vent metagenome]|uniref:Uncharacterized protein n=1 Tax=hydrothermal vent metagenome TaxID=652676 RepID=A0A3B1A5X1_9ZZZZ
MKCRIYEKWFYLLTSFFVFGQPSVAFADAPDVAGASTRAPHHSARHAENNIEIEYFSMGDSKSNMGNSQVGTSGVLIQTEYENNNMVYTFNYERWNYNWTNPETLPFVSGATNAPWSSFNTLQFGVAYEQELNDKWEFNYYIEAESSFEKETSGSNEYELGVDFIYEPSKAWVYTLNVNLEYLDATGGELGVDLEIEWNHGKKDGWSGEFEISSEFPETSLTYHFTRAFSTTMFYNESGSSTIRLSDSSPVIGMQGGYFEDEYNALGIKVNYEFTYESYLSFAFQQNTGRSFSFVDSSGRTETAYEFADTIEAAIGLSYTF